MLWIKTFHIIFVASWFSGLFYLPRIFVNLAMLEEQDDKTRSRLILMAEKLLKFMTLLSLPSIILGTILWQVYGLGFSIDFGWMQLKFLFVLLICLYHIYCFKLLKNFKNMNNQHSHLWYRWFNEIPVILMLYIVALVVNKPNEVYSFTFNLTGYLVLILTGFILISVMIKKYKSKTTNG